MTIKDILIDLNKDNININAINSIANNKLIKDKPFNEARNVLVKILSGQGYVKTARAVLMYKEDIDTNCQS